MSTCTACEGTGKKTTGVDGLCWECQGTGNSRATDPTYNLDEIHQCKGCRLSKHVNSKGYCQRCNGPMEPDELDELDKILAEFAREKWYPEIVKQYSNYSQAKNALQAHIAKQVDAAVAEQIMQDFMAYNTINGADESEFIAVRDEFLEQLKQGGSSDE